MVKKEFLSRSMAQGVFNWTEMWKINLIILQDSSGALGVDDVAFKSLESRFLSVFDKSK